MKNVFFMMEEGKREKNTQQKKRKTRERQTDKNNQVTYRSKNIFFLFFIDG
jgi:hypothetical protein